MSKYIGLTGELTPKNENDDYTLLDSYYVRGGFKCVRTITDRDNIPMDRRSIDMIVEVLNDDRYILKNGIENTDWEPYLSERSLQSNSSIEYGTITIDEIQ